MESASRGYRRSQLTGLLHRPVHSRGGHDPTAPEGLGSTSEAVWHSSSPFPPPHTNFTFWLEQPYVKNSARPKGREKQRPPGGVLTFGVQGLDLQLQRGVLQVEFTGCGHNLNAMDEVHDSITAKDLARG